MRTQILHWRDFKNWKLLCLFCSLLVISSIAWLQIDSVPYSYPTKVSTVLNTSKGIHCFRKNAASLPSILETTPKKGSIFFLETSCHSFDKGKITITARQACAVESAAKMNPNSEIYLLYASPGVFQYEGTETDRILKALLAYENVNLFHLDYDKYTANTPVRNLYESGAIAASNYPESHASDVFRYLTLWKYGGIYLDLDVVVIKNMEQLKYNFAGFESDEVVGSGILSFAPDGIGHQLALTALNDLKYNFNGQAWTNNGPGVITRLLKSTCMVEKLSFLPKQQCRGFKVYPEYIFTPIPWWNWTHLFEESYNEIISKATKNSYTVHIWNKLSGSSRIMLKSEVPYLQLARKYCPKVIEQCTQYF